MQKKYLFKPSKPLLLLLAMFCFFGNQTFSQTVYSNKASSIVSFSVGLTSSNLIKDSIDYTSGILFNGGVVYSLTLSEKINIAAEILYAGKGFKRDLPIIKYRYFYVDIPLYLQVKLSENVRLNVGAQYSKFTNSQVINIDGSNKNGVHVQKFNNIKNDDYGFLVGAEIDFTENLAMGARYTISSSTFFEKNKPNFGVFQLSFKYAIYRSYKQLFDGNEATQ